MTKDFTMGQIDAIMRMADDHEKAYSASNENLARWLLMFCAKTNVTWREYDLFGACAERLYPGIVELVAKGEAGER